MLRAGALRDGMGREVGGGFRMGSTYKSMADSYQCKVNIFKSNNIFNIVS